MTVPLLYLGLWVTCGDYRSPTSRHNPDRVSPTLDAILARSVLRFGTTVDIAAMKEAIGALPETGVHGFRARP
jgi:hypothetical protein